MWFDVINVRTHWHTLNHRPALCDALDTIWMLLQVLASDAMCATPTLLTLGAVGVVERMAYSTSRLHLPLGLAEC